MTHACGPDRASTAKSLPVPGERENHHKEVEAESQGVLSPACMWVFNFSFFSTVYYVFYIPFST